MSFASVSLNFLFKYQFYLVLFTPFSMDQLNLKSKKTYLHALEQMKMKENNEPLMLSN